MSIRVLMVIAPEAFRDEELLIPRAQFEQAGWHVDTVSTQTGVVQGMLGVQEEITQTLDDVDPNTYEAIVVVGGMGSPEFLWQNKKLHSLLRTLEANGKVVSAICLSGAVLALAGLLKGKKATVWEMPESLAAFQNNGVTYTGEPVTIDGNFITANGPDAAEHFGQAIMEKVTILAPV